jgi:hypothetical protein
MTTEIWTVWEAKYPDGHAVFAKDLSYCGLTPLEKDLFELMQKHRLYELNVIEPEQIEVTFNPAYVANLTWNKSNIVNGRCKH